MALEKHGTTLAGLKDTIGGGVSLQEVKYHVSVLVRTECLKVERPSAESGTGEDVLRADPDVFLEPLYLERAAAFAEQESVSLNWMEISVGAIGREQIFDIIRTTRLEFLMVEEQSRSRRAITSDEITPIVVGAVAFDAIRRGKKR
jgi:hypothetical protein